MNYNQFSRLSFNERPSTSFLLGSIPTHLSNRFDSGCHYTFYLFYGLIEHLGRYFYRCALQISSWNVENQRIQFNTLHILLDFLIDKTKVRLKLLLRFRNPKFLFKSRGHKEPFYKSFILDGV